MGLLDNFLFYDIAFLILFTAWVVWFLYTRKHNLKKEGIIYLYRTKLGIKLIDYVGKKYKRTLGVVQYFCILIGYLLMIGILWILAYSVYTYIRFPQITEVVRAPPVIPLIPYFPSLFGLQSFFPPLYFTYWIVALLVVASVHEFAHGILAKYHGLKIKSTGFAFLGPILGAFVEPDEKEMQKKKKIPQLSILSAGVFANIVFAGIFFICLWGIFGLAFQPAGVIINSYAGDVVNMNEITGVNNINFEGNFEGFLDMDLTTINVKDQEYVIQTKLLEDQLNSENFRGLIFLYYDSPAFNDELVGAISQINEDKITSTEELTIALSKYSPGDEINVQTIYGDEIKSYEVVLAENPRDSEKGFLGITLNSVQGEGLRASIADTLFFKDPGIFYEEKNNFIVFIYYLFWWLVMINFFVGLFNMLPLGILDGGRFFYLTILGITNSEKVTKQIYKTLFYLIVGIFLALILAWLFAL